jgi:hypothetical protein
MPKPKPKPKPSPKPKQGQQAEAAVEEVAPPSVRARLAAAEARLAY